MKEIYFRSRDDYANYMALMRLAREESILPELMLTDRGVNRIKMNMGLTMKYDKIYLNHYLRSFWRGYPKKITMADKFTKLNLP